MDRIKLVAAMVLFVASTVTVALAGTVIVVDTWAYDQYTESGVARMYAGENKLRVEFKGKESNVQVIFDVENKNEPVMWIIDPATQTYTKMDAKAIKKTRDTMQQSYEMFDSYMKTASAEEREEITQKYKAQLRQAEHMIKFEERMKKTTFQRVASGEKVMDHTCDHLKGMLGKEMRKEVWIAPWSDLGLEYKDVAVMTAVSDAFKGFAGETIPFVAQKVEGSDTPVDGFPIQTFFYENGTKIIRQQVKEIRKEELDPKLFVVPDGYKEKPPVSN